MAEKRRRYDAEFREGAVRLVAETGKPIAEVSRDLGINEGTLHSWIGRAKKAGGDGSLAESEREELARLRGRTRRSPSGSRSLRWSVMSSSDAWPSG
ncbi:transposase [Streptomyces sp. NPDC048479]|uniref:transposase n=1 Tax=Streptomyces sp. NPDC048479 TaxID=3154725 RepID=UPI0034127990